MSQEKFDIKFIEAKDEDVLRMALDELSAEVKRNRRHMWLLIVMVASVIVTQWWDVAAIRLGLSTLPF